MNGEPNLFIVQNAIIYMKCIDITMKCTVHTQQYCRIINMT